MSFVEGKQWIRQAGLFVAPHAVGDLPLAAMEALDLSEMRFKFEVRAADVQSPNNAAIRVYNLSDDTVRRIRGEFGRVVLQAGYAGGALGIIFSGTIKELRIGKENATDKYLDILAADGDLAYNQGFVNKTFAAGTSAHDIAAEAAKAMGVTLAHMPTNNYVLPRGKVLFGLARNAMNKAADTLGATWSIQNGKVQMIPMQGYLPGQAVEINSASGMIGLPEQTDQGINVRALLNPKLRIGALIRLNNNSINRSQLNSIVPFNSFRGTRQSAPLNGDGLYRLFAVEHIGDSRGNEWYSDMVGLAVSPAADSVVSAA